MAIVRIYTDNRDCGNTYICDDCAPASDWVELGTGKPCDDDDACDMCG